MTRFKLRHVDSFTDRNGHKRYYFRRGRGVRMALPGSLGSAEFMEAYQAALTGGPAPATKTPRRRGAPGTFDDLAQRYFESANYARLSQSTRHTYKLLIERLIAD